MPETLDSLGQKLDRILALVTPVPGPDTVAPPRLWAVRTVKDADKIEPEMTPIGRFGVYQGGVVRITCSAGPLDSCVWFDHAGNVLAVGDLPVDLVPLDVLRTARVTAKAHCAAAAAQPRLDLNMDLYVGVRRPVAPAGTASGQAGREDLASRWSPLIDWPASWPPVSDEGRMPQLPEARDVETLRLYARHGYERDGTPMRGPVSLGFAGQEVQRIAEMGDSEYATSRYGNLVRDLACYGVLTKRIKVSYDVGMGADLQSEPMMGVAYPSLQALLDREVGMFGSGDNAGPGRG